MIKQIAIILPTLAFLQACGGGSTGPAGFNQTPTPASFRTLRQFSDGAGVGRAVDADGVEMVFISPDIAEVVAEGNRTYNSPIDDIQFSDFPVVQRLAHSTVRQGTMTIEGEVANVTIIEDNGGDAGILYLDLGYADAVVATGTPYGTAPGGTFSYEGTHLIGDRYYGGIEDGTFTLTANFTSKTFSYAGSTVSSTLNGTGIIDTANGRFQSSNLTSNVLGSVNSASMYGQLHGQSAQAVSGVFHTNEADPNYAGAFIGSQK